MDNMKIYRIKLGEPMVQVLYDFPLPNNGERYDLSQKELHELLDYVYKCGFENARNIWDPARQGVLTWASYEDKDDPNKWYIDGGHNG